MKHRNRKLFPTVILMGFLLGVHAEHLALLEGNRPVRIYEMPLACLPPADRQSLCRGIPVTDPRQLTVLLEDFLS